jgi:hypothetical protein
MQMIRKFQEIIKEIFHIFLAPSLTTCYFRLMAATPASEASARKILTLFVKQFSCEPGHVLVPNNLLKRGLTEEELKKGLEFAIRKDWIEITRGGQYKLTELGFSAAQQDS